MDCSILTYFSLLYFFSILLKYLFTAVARTGGNVMPECFSRASRTKRRIGFPLKTWGNDLLSIQSLDGGSTRLQYFFTINIFFAIFFWGSCSLFPRWVFNLYGLTPNDAALWTARLFGGSILGFASLMWVGQKAISVEVRRAIAFALFIQDVIGCIASVEFQITGNVNIFGWLSLSLYGLLAIAYAFFLFVKPENC